ncbi:hypothetical protein V6N11_031599 [Hibiscus sabdariffa]|uniref:Uncharacterized protein n=1 Tax=Hibiscus sabdariffa TaxID=183260 RepID=A0ABR2SY41_9ROSI
MADSPATPGYTILALLRRTVLFTRHTKSIYNTSLSISFHSVTYGVGGEGSTLSSFEITVHFFTIFLFFCPFGEEELSNTSEGHLSLVKEALLCWDCVYECCVSVEWLHRSVYCGKLNFVSVAFEGSLDVVSVICPLVSNGWLVARGRGTGWFSLLSES